MNKYAWRPLLAAALLALATADAGAGNRPAAPVPPTQEIVVLDPNVDPNGDPAIQLRRGGGMTTIDVPPSVLVHRFYYTGDRNFQAQMLPGGPSVIVVNHPRSGERVYVPVVLPPGAPRVKYCSSNIEYDYGFQSVSVHFGPLCKSTVTYKQQGTELGERIHKKSAEMVARAKELLDRTGIPDTCRNLKEVCRETKNNVADGFRTTSQALIITPIKNGVRLLPGANAILPAP